MSQELFFQHFHWSLVGAAKSYIEWRSSERPPAPGCGVEVGPSCGRSSLLGGPSLTTPVP
jgi:hypothetical protein